MFFVALLLSCGLFGGESMIVLEVEAWPSG